MRVVIGECLRQAGVVTEADLRAALAEQGRTGERLGSTLLRMKLATGRQIGEALARQLGLAFVDLYARPPDAAAVARIPREIALKYTCIVLAADRNVLTVATSDPLQLVVVQDLEFRTGCRITQVVATREQILEAIRVVFPDAAAPQIPPRAAPLVPSERPGRAETAPLDAAPIVEMVDRVIKNALREGASDIHIEPNGTGVVVRYRLDGLLSVAKELPKWAHDGLVARIKVMAELDIAEKRLPQDGRIRTRTDDGYAVDLRVSTLRTVLGEKVVLRVLDHRRGVPPLDALGLSPAALTHLRAFLRAQHGMVLVVGPTGSGKTTTLCSALAAMRSGRTNIVTIEDPVEYQIPGVNQTQINTRIDLTFARALRAILRQDPDVVLVGEIRDQDTARVALQAAQTGHLVLSTLHTDDAPSSVARLTDIGVEPYVTASALVGVVAQRLVRRLCTHCRCPSAPDADALRALRLSRTDASSATFYQAVGCPQCHQTGYRGRVGIYEVMPVNDALRRRIARRDTSREIREAARALGMLSMMEDGVSKVTAGLTSIDELLRVVAEAQVPLATCVACGGDVEPDFVVCPACGQHVGGGCSQCGRSIHTEWTCCPYCTKALDEGAESPEARPRLRAVR